MNPPGLVIRHSSKKVCQKNLSCSNVELVITQSASASANGRFSELSMTISTDGPGSMSSPTNLEPAGWWSRSEPLTEHAPNSTISLFSGFQYSSKNFPAILCAESCIAELQASHCRLPPVRNAH